MSVDNFDKEVSQLYQQRKSEINAPHIDVHLPTKPIKQKLSLSRLFAIFFIGGAASFGVFAVISYLANTDQVTKSTFSANHIVEIKKIDTEKVTEKSVVVQQVLPPKPKRSEPIKTQTVPTQVQNASDEFTQFEIQSPQIQVVTIPKIKEPKLIVTPIYKVIPKYPLEARRVGSSGVIRLKYRINAQGKVDNIDVINSTLERSLQKSAKKALAQWQYPPNARYETSYEIIFEFNNQ